MDTLHRMLTSFNTETKSATNHLTVFREFLAHLDKIQRKSPPAKPSRAKSRVARKPAKRSRKS